MLSGQIYVGRIRKWYSFPKQRQYRKRINNWPKVLPNDGHSLRKLTNFLQHCLMAMNTVEYLNMLNDQKKKKQKMIRKRQPRARQPRALQLSLLLLVG